MDSGTLISILIGIVTVVVAIWIYKLQQTRKVAAYKIVPNPSEYQYETNLLAKRGERLLLIKIQNVGNVPITMEDYYNSNPITFDFGKGTEVLQVEVLETIPRSIEAEVKEKLKFGLGKLSIAPLLLNRYSIMKLKVKLAKFNGEVNVEDMQIIGGKIVNFDDTLYAKIMLNPNQNPLIELVKLFLSYGLIGAFLFAICLPGLLGVFIVASILGISFGASADTVQGGIAGLIGIILGLYYSSKVIFPLFSYKSKIKLL